MAHRGRRKHLSFFLVKILGRKKSASFAEAVGVAAGVKDVEAGAEAVDLVGEEDMAVPIVIRLMMVIGSTTEEQDGAVAVVVVAVEGVATTITTATTITIVPTKETATIAVTVGGVDSVSDIRGAITAEAISMGTNNLLPTAMAMIMTVSTEGTSTTTTTALRQGITNKVSIATISHIMTNSIRIFILDWESLWGLYNY